MVLLVHANTTGEVLQQPVVCGIGVVAILAVSSLLCLSSLVRYLHSIALLAGRLDILYLLRRSILTFGGGGGHVLFQVLHGLRGVWVGRFETPERLVVHETVFIQSGYVTTVHKEEQLERLKTDTDSVLGALKHNHAGFLGPGALNGLERSLWSVDRGVCVS